MSERTTVLKPFVNEARRLVKAFGYTCAGFAAAFRTQASFRTDVLVFLFLLPFVFVVGDSAAQRGVLFTSLVLLVMAELLNTGIESAVDRVSLEYHDLTKQAKDVGSAAVFMAIVNIVITWGLVIHERFF